MSVDDIDAEMADFACFETLPDEIPPVMQKVVRVKKQSQCPCGSNLRYRKCCMERDKQRAKKLMRKNTGNSTSATTSEQSTTSATSEGDDEPAMDGDFRVLKI